MPVLTGLLAFEVDRAGLRLAVAEVERALLLRPFMLFVVLPPFEVLDFFPVVGFVDLAVVDFFFVDRFAVDLVPDFLLPAALFAAFLVTAI